MASVPLVLVHSPLVGPTTWRAVAEQLVADGHEVVVPALAESLRLGPPYQERVAGAVADQVAQAAPEGSVVLVGHSGAGPLLPRLADALAVEVDGAVYVDSLLPQAGASWFDRAPHQLAEHLRGLARDGVLPPWDQWFGPGAVAELLPDPDLRRRFVAELPSVPLAYFEEAAARACWSGPSAYLLLSDGYRPDAEQARAAGWPVAEHHGHHLAMLTEPGVVAGVLLSAVHQLPGRE